LRGSDYERASSGRRQRFDDDEPQHQNDYDEQSYDDHHDENDNDDEPDFLRRGRRRRLTDREDHPGQGDRWSTWDQSEAGNRGSEPYPDWLVRDLAAVDTELGVVKTGKEADVHLVRRGVPGTDRECLLAAKRYRSAEHRMFHRDAGYLEGRRVRESRTNRAMAKRTGFGRETIAATWALAEWGALRHLWDVGEQLGVRIVPYPVQILGSELLLEFLGTPDGEAAPRLVQLRPNPDELDDLWRQSLDGLTVLARCGLAHGDLSPYNMLVHEGRLVLIDLPQVVDVVSNPRGPEFLARDVHNVVSWFTTRGKVGLDTAELTQDLLYEAGMRHL
jgi:RIO kinase 1